MRLWSLHPRYLDAAGLVAAWREALLAQKVLAGLTTGYTAHPQLARFRGRPAEAIGTFLHGLADEADARAYRFDRTRITSGRDDSLRIPVADGQLAYEWAHLVAKLASRSPGRLRELGVDDPAAVLPDPHPLFVVVPGPVEAWEVVRPVP
ncbi:pyrimidine dimer DNA glycosylase/endonuclease V [Agromyces sp. MMS24-JH15]|uniref:pyrimidine dimer DNA glycosylase/endonuclease V n=1 Tax=Agromyces sp. MMS24-JH15 TaxID=3243765 RepID=UPI003748FCF6